MIKGKKQRIQPLIGFLAVALLGVSNMASAQSAQEVVQKDPEVKIQPAPKVAYDLPKTDLTAEVTFATLLSNTALDRGDVAMAYQGYIFLANKTRDPRYAELAYRVAAMAGDLESGMIAASLLKKLAPNATVGQELADVARMAGIRVLLSREEYVPAYKAVKAILAQEPKNTQALAMLTELADILGYGQEALSAAQTWLKIEPESAEALNALGYYLADKNQRLGEAEKILTKALKLKPNAPHILDSMGWLAYRQNRLADATVYLKQALQLDSSVDVFTHLGEVQWKNNEQEAALESFKFAYQLNAFSPVLRDTLERLSIPLNRVNVAPSSQPAIKMTKPK